MAQKLGYFEEAGLDVAIQTPSDPAAPLKLRRRRPYRPGDLLRARGDPGPRTGPRRGRRRRPGQPAADLDDLAEEIGDQGRRRACAARRSPPPGSPTRTPYLKTILGRAKLSTSDVKAVNVGFGLLPALLGGKRPGDARRLQQRRGRRPAAARQRPGRHPGRQARRADLRRAGAGRAAASGYRKTRRRSGSSSPRWPAAPPLPPRTRRRRPKHCWKPTRTSTRN